MKTGDLAKFLADTVQRPRGTVADYIAALQAAGLINLGSRGRYSGADLTETDCINALLAVALEHPRGSPPSVLVSKVRNMFHEERPLAIPPGFQRGLKCFTSATAGGALDNLIGDVRTGRLAAWSDDEPFTLRVTIESNGGSVYLSLLKEAQIEGETLRHASQTFLVPGTSKIQPLVERHITLSREWFEQMAERLGPRD